MKLTSLSDRFAVSPQLVAEDIADLAAMGFRTVINNRPDGEAADQPTSATIEAEAERYGLAYHHIPIVPDQARDSDARAMADALQHSEGKVVAFCRTGNRSQKLWEMAGKPS